MKYKYKKLVLLMVVMVVLLLISEFVNYMSDPASPSSILLNKYFVNKSILEAKNGKFEKSIYYLSIASKINIYGEFDHYRNLLPPSYKKPISKVENGQLKSQIVNYLSEIKDFDLAKNQDQGIAKIYYNLGLIAYKNENFELTPYFFNMAMLNNPEFASFHVELINYYFINNLKSDVEKEMDYCSKFSGSRLMCVDYKNNSIDTSIPREVGFLRDEVGRHYNSR